MNLEEVRRFALSLPEVTEQPHFEFTSFRVGRIFATGPPDEEHLHIFLDPDESRALAGQDPEVFSELWWGRQLLGVRVRLAPADPTLICEVLEEAWRRKAPKRLLG